MSVTISHIAERTGLSVPTVGNVLGKASFRYSAQTRQRVMDAVREMGYRPNASARATRRGSTGCIALVLSRSHLNVFSHLPAGLLDGLDEELAKHNMHLSVSLLTDEELCREDFVPKVLRELVADGMIVNYTQSIPQQMLEMIHAHHAPAVWLNAKMDADCIFPDDLGGATMATQSLIAQGHRHIAFIHLIRAVTYPGMNFEQVKPRLHFSVADRIRGYSKAMTDAGLKPVVGYEDRFVVDDQMIDACSAILSSAHRPTAVLAYSYNETPTVVLAARKLGLSVPRDLTVLQFSPIAQTVAGIDVPSVYIPTRDIGRRAVRMLLQKIKSPYEMLPPEAVRYGNSFAA